jgi:hypothetical protein
MIHLTAYGRTDIERRRVPEDREDAPADLEDYGEGFRGCLFR